MRNFFAICARAKFAGEEISLETASAETNIKSSSGGCCANFNFVFRESKVTSLFKRETVLIVDSTRFMERHIVQEKAQKKTALIITPPESVWPAIQQIRSQHDQKASTVWMPHIKLLFPFVDEDLFKVPQFFPTSFELINFLLALVINYPICIINNSTFYQ